MCVSVRLTVCLMTLSVAFFVHETAQAREKQQQQLPVSLDRLVYPEEDYYNSDSSLHSNHYHSHHHHFHHPEDEDYDDRARGQPTTARAKTPEKQDKTNINEIPLSLIKEINNKEYTINDLLLHYVDDYEEEPAIENRFGEEKSTVKMATDAKCKPELQTVNLVEDKDPSVLYIPTCTRIERCGGCCMHELLECQPIEVETVNLQVYRGSYKGGKNFKFDGKEIVTIEKHKKCKCDCKVRQKDCTAMQAYEKDNCRCSCRNSDEEKKCLKENSTKLWNPTACACQCRQELLCTTGSLFDYKQCKCVVKQVRRRNADQFKRGSWAMSVLPLQTNN